MDLVRGKNVYDAKLTLAFDKTKAARMILKVLRSAESNAKNNHNLDADKMYLSELYVTPGRTQKWGRPGSKGRFNPILKRSSHIVVGLSSKEVPASKAKSPKKEEGKGSKNKK